MKKTLLTLAVAGTLTMAISACNSTKSVSGTTDTMAVDTNMKTVDTMKTMPPDTTKMPPKK